MLCVLVICCWNVYFFCVIRFLVVNFYLCFNFGIKCMFDWMQFVDGIGQFNNIVMIVVVGDDY